MGKHDHIFVDGREIKFKVTKKPNPIFGSELFNAMYMSQDDCIIKASDEQLDALAEAFAKSMKAHEQQIEREKQWQKDMIEAQKNFNPNGWNDYPHAVPPNGDWYEVDGGGFDENMKPDGERYSQKLRFDFDSKESFAAWVHEDGRCHLFSGDIKFRKWSEK